MIKGFRTRLVLVIILMTLLSIFLSRFYALDSIDINMYDSNFAVSYNIVIFSFLIMLYLIIETLFYIQAKRKNEQNN